MHIYFNADDSGPRIELGVTFAKETIISLFDKETGLEIDLTPDESKQFVSELKGLIVAFEASQNNTEVY